MNRLHNRSTLGTYYLQQMKEIWNAFSICRQKKKSNNIPIWHALKASLKLYKNTIRLKLQNSHLDLKLQKDYIGDPIFHQHIKYIQENIWKENVKTCESQWMILVHTIYLWPGNFHELEDSTLLE